MFCCIFTFFYTPWAQKGIRNNTKLGNGTRQKWIALILNIEKTKSEVKLVQVLHYEQSSEAYSFVNSSNTDAFSKIDDPEQFENLKQRKKAFLEGVRQFSKKAKVPNISCSRNFLLLIIPKDIAVFLLETRWFRQGSNREYLGEGDERM